MRSSHIVEAGHERTSIAKAVFAWSNVTNYLSSVFPSPQSIATGIASVAATVPVLAYVFALPIGVSPEQLTFAIWESQSTGMKMLSIAFTLVTLGTGTLTRYQHIPNMLKKMRELLGSYCQSLPAFISNNFILFMSSLAALASLALGYYGYLWAGMSVAVGIAAINFLITFGFRIEYMTDLIGKIRNIFDQDQQFQNDLINELKRIKPEHIERFESDLKKEMSAGHLLDEEVVRKCLINLYDESQYTDSEAPDSAQHQLQLFNPPAAIDNIKYYLQRTIDIGLGTIVGGATLILFSQYGYDGLNILIQLSTGTAGMNDLPAPARLSIGLLAAVSSGILGFLTGSEITNTINNAYDYIKKDRKNTIKVILVMLSSGIAATSIASAANAMIKKPNLFNMMDNSAAGYYLIGGNWLFAVSLDSSGILRLISKNNPTLTNAVHWMEKHRLSTESISALKQLSYFKRQKKESEPLIQDEKVVPDKSLTYSTFL